ncbi:hypothetical protein BS47DRAFT_331724 [Hydnum rufescens UP504]|uniref:Uncharacterized protein n=1 Tax=Hydnum rufescens UP504 TaxID=1448309 RepID=A0A9P6DX98_9AGAM|nr:hypothetical protein BS47DRAFT_331724 [Hydnum rufescens UP504]
MRTEQLICAEYRARSGLPCAAWGACRRPRHRTSPIFPAVPHYERIRIATISN